MIGFTIYCLPSAHGIWLNPRAEEFFNIIYLQSTLDYGHCKKPMTKFGQIFKNQLINWVNFKIDNQCEKHNNQRKKWN